MRYSPLVQRQVERARDGGHRIPHSAASRSMWDKPPSLDYNAVLRIVSPKVRRLFVQLHKDEETQSFLEQYCSGEPFWRYLLTSAFRQCLSITDTNAILGRGQMFVASTAQLKHLLRRSQLRSTSDSDTATPSTTTATADPGNVPLTASINSHSPTQTSSDPSVSADSSENIDDGLSFRTLLDIGAGDGTVTNKLVPLLAGLPPIQPRAQHAFTAGTISEYLGFSSPSAKEPYRNLTQCVVATEASRSMCSRLTKKGFTSIQTCDVADVISRFGRNSFTCWLG